MAGHPAILSWQSVEHLEEIERKTTAFVVSVVLIYSALITNAMMMPAYSLARSYMHAKAQRQQQRRRRQEEGGLETETETDYCYDGDETESEDDEHRYLLEEKRIKS